MKKLDLHRIRHEYVRNETIRFIESNWGSGEEVEIVTGNSAEMRGLIMNILNEYGLTHRIGRMFDLNNKGYIVTCME